MARSRKDQGTVEAPVATTPGSENSRQSRREMLKVAGAAVAGAAGGLAAGALQPLTASAANGSALVIGATNDGNGAPATQLIPTAATTPFEMLRIVGGGQANAAIGLGALQVRGQNGGEGIDAVCNGGGGWALQGLTDSGQALRGLASTGIGLLAASSTGIDAALTGAGRLYQNPNIAAGPPAYSPNNQEQVRDANGVLWLSHQGSYANGWAPAQPGASFVGSPGTSLFTAVTNLQYHLTGSDGMTWVPLDPTNLKITFTPTFNALGILTANSSLWTDTAGFNQDLAIFVNGSLHSWQESGGFAGTFSPNAVAVHGVFGSFFRGTAYTVDLRWKANKADGNTIYAGAGPLPATGFSPTRLTVQLVIIG